MMDAGHLRSLLRKPEFRQDLADTINDLIAEGRIRLPGTDGAPRTEPPSRSDPPSNPEGSPC